MQHKMWARVRSRCLPSRTPRPRRLLGPVPSIAAALILLVGSALPAMPPARPNVGPGAAIAGGISTLPVELPPASVSQVPKPPSTPSSLGSAPSRPTGSTGRVSQALFEPSPWSVPNVLLDAYSRAVAAAPAGCHLPVSLLAAIGQVESGSLAGRSIDSTHRAVPPVLGPVLDGLTTAAIRDTDEGRLDGNRQWDRAVGPMQFIPGTWAAFAGDADGNGRADPQNVYDAAAAAAAYLCAHGRDLSLASGLRSAILAYNHSNSYLATVLAWQRRFEAPGRRTIQAVSGMLNAPTTIATSTAIISVATSHHPAAAAHPSPTTTSTPSRDVIVPPAAKLAFTTAPSPTSTSGTALSTQPVVTIQDAAGNTTTANTSTVTLTLTTPAGASLTCAANPTAATSGIASFTGCAIDISGIYTLTATDGSLTPATSASVTVNPALTPTATATVSTTIVNTPVNTPADTPAQ